MCESFCIDFIECMFAGKTLLNYTNLFSPNDYKNNGRWKKYGGRSKSRV